jgi:hypothetical protein
MNHRETSVILHNLAEYSRWSTSTYPGPAFDVHRFGPKARLTGHAFDGHACRAECCLRYGVVLGEEDEQDDVADAGVELIGCDLVAPYPDVNEMVSV